MLRLLAALLIICATFPAVAESSFMTGRGVANGVFAIVSLPAQSVQNTLPKGLSVAPEAVLPGGLYPVVVFAGEQEVDYMGTYLEAVMTLTVRGPYSEDARYTYTTKIVVDSWPALLAGRALGYPKRMAKLQKTDKSFHGAFSKKSPALNIVFEDVAEFDEDTFKKNLSFVAGRVYPTIGKTPAGFVCFDFNWDFDSAQVSPVNAKVELFQAFSGAPLAGTHLSPRMDQSPYGAMRIKSSWTLKNLRSCH